MRAPLREDFHQSLRSQKRQAWHGWVIGVFMMLVALASRTTGIATRPDPVPHAMVLTGIVVAVSATALGLALQPIGHLRARGAWVVELQ